MHDTGDYEDICTLYIYVDYVDYVDYNVEAEHRFAKQPYALLCCIRRYNFYPKIWWRTLSHLKYPNVPKNNVAGYHTIPYMVIKNHF